MNGYETSQDNLNKFKVY